MRGLQDQARQLYQLGLSDYHALKHRLFFSTAMLVVAGSLVCWIQGAQAVSCPHSHEEHGAVDAGTSLLKTCCRFGTCMHRVNGRSSLASDLLVRTAGGSEPLQSFAFGGCVGLAYQLMLAQSVDSVASSSAYDPVRAESHLCRSSVAQFHCLPACIELCPDERTVLDDDVFSK